jgi:hypothetical protein
MSNRAKRLLFWSSAIVVGLLFGFFVACGGDEAPSKYGEVITPPGLARVVTTAPATGSGTTSNPVSVQTFGTSQAGAVPSSGGGSTNFLRADGSWAIPIGTGVPSTRTLSTTSPLAGGGDLSANRTLSINTNGITDSLLRQGAGVSVIGRSANSTGNVADIVAAADGQVLARSGGVLAFADPSSIVPSVVPYMGVFGDGSDGAIVFDGTTTITVNGTSFVPDANQRYVITRDLMATNITINSGVVVVPAAIDNEKQCNTGGTVIARKIYATGTLTVTGKIRSTGCGAQSAAITGHGTLNGLGGASSLNASAVSSAGSNGSGTGTPAASGALTNHVWITTTATSGGAIGVGGSPGAAPFMGGGGGGSSFAGGPTGTITTIPVAVGSVRDFRALTSGAAFNSTTVTGICMGGIGGGGGAYGGIINATGGNGGGGGGFVAILAFTITGSGSIEAPGADGSVGGTNGANGGGGGGGGGGGAIVIAYANGTVPTTTVAGGNGGLGGGTLGKSGGAGAAGKVFLLH